MPGPPGARPPVAGPALDVGRERGEHRHPGAPVSAGMVLLAIGLAVLGGLVAGTIGGMRAARLRPAEALRSLG